MQLNRRKWLVAQLLLLSACGRIDSDLLSAESTPNKRNIPNTSNTYVPTENSAVIQASRIIEEFDSLRQITETEKSNVTVDINQGLLSLPLQFRLPDVPSEEASPSVTLVTEYTSRVVSQTCIVIEDQVEITAPDSIELTATDSIRIAGNLTAGEGGITLIANKSIHVDGQLTSTGPIRVIVPQASGTIAITGLVKTLNSDIEKSSNITIITRGSVDIFGELKTSDTSEDRTGDIVVVSYGPISIQGNKGRIETGHSRGGNAGNILLSSESLITMNDGALLRGGEASSNSEQDEQNLGGNIDIRAHSLLLDRSVQWTAGNCNDCNAGSISVTVEQSSRIGQRSYLQSGNGRNGGDITLVSGSLIIGNDTNIRAGEGRLHAGRTYFETTKDLELEENVLVYGGAGQCAEGGPVVGLVGNTLKIGNGSWLKGGASVLGETDCVSAARGGDVQFFCSEIIGNFDQSTKPGPGSPRGDITLNINPDYERPIPNPHPQSFGYLESKTFDRGQEHVKASAKLSSILHELPDGTRVDIMIAGANEDEGPFSEWFTLDETTKSNDSVVGYQFIRYRIEVHGRTLDTPVLDRFEIDLTSHQ